MHANRVPMYCLITSVFVQISESRNRVYLDSDGLLLGLTGGEEM